MNIRSRVVLCGCVSTGLGSIRECIFLVKRSQCPEGMPKKLRALEQRIQNVFSKWKQPWRRMMHGAHRLISLLTPPHTETWEGCRCFPSMRPMQTGSWSSTSSLTARLSAPPFPTPSHPTISLPTCASSGPTQNIPQHSPSCLHGHTQGLCRHIHRPVRVSAKSWKASLDAVHAQYIPEQFFPPDTWRCLESFQVVVMGKEDLFTGSF